MIDDENRTDLIDRYLEGDLSDEDRREFEERMENNREFRKEVALQQKIAQTVKEQERAKLKNEIKQLFEEEINNKESGSAPVIDISSRWRTFAIAAAVAALLVASVIFIVNRTEVVGPQIVYLEVKLLPGSRGSLPVPDSLALEVITEDPAYSFHYQLGDTLRLYGDFDLDALGIFYEPNDNQYLLQWKGREYELVETEEVLPIE